MINDTNNATEFDMVSMYIWDEPKQCLPDIKKKIVIGPTCHVSLVCVLHAHIMIISRGGP